MYRLLLAEQFFARMGIMWQHVRASRKLSRHHVRLGFCTYPCVSMLQLPEALCFGIVRPSVCVYNWAEAFFRGAWPQLLASVTAS